MAQLREQVADYDALIERLTKAFAKLKAGHELLQRGGAWGEVKKYSGRARRPAGSTVSAGRPENGSRPHSVG